MGEIKRIKSAEEEEEDEERKIADQCPGMLQQPFANHANVA